MNTIISEEDFMLKAVNELPFIMQAKISCYITHVKLCGTRLCNDGFPDTRFKSTYRKTDKQAREAISKIRKKCKLYFSQEEARVRGKAFYSEAPCTKTNCNKEVAEGYIAKMRAMFK